jgi:hypothetical protein
MAYHLIIEAATYTAHNKHKRRISLPSVGFKPTTPAMRQHQTYSLDLTAPGSVPSNYSLREVMEMISHGNHKMLRKGCHVSLSAFSWQASTDLLVSVTSNTGLRRWWSNLSWLKCLQVAKLVDSLHHITLSQNLKFSALMWSSKNGISTSLWIYLLPAYQGALFTITSDNLWLNLENDPLSAYHPLSTVVHPDHTGACLFYVLNVEMTYSGTPCSENFWTLFFNKTTQV